MNYRVVFDVSTNGSQLAIWFLIPVFPLLFGLIGWGLKGDPRIASKGMFFVVFSAVGFTLTVAFAIAQYSEYCQAKKALETGNYKVAEGTVAEFVPMPPGGHATESFKVGDSSFQYGSGWGAFVFNSEWNHGYIHNGSKARIAYHDQDILRVEVK